MADDIEFDVAASDIIEQVVVVRDPQLVVTIEKWLSKLTSEDRGPNELNYLKLLQHMMNNRRIGPPFVRPPPVGPLLPLSRYINPPPCNGHPSVVRRRAEVWRTNNFSRGAQTEEFENNQEDDDQHMYDTVSNVTRDMNVEDSKISIVASSVDNDKQDVSHDNDRKTDRAAVGNADGKLSIEQNKRDGHLAGGGGECSSCWGGKDCGEKKGATKKPKPFVKLCSPCIDDVGKHLKKPLPGPIDTAYANLLGDCALPSLTEVEKKSICPDMLKVLESVNDSTTLQDFYFQVSLCTCDQGVLLMRVSDGMVDDFRTFVSGVFESRAEHISDGLAKEQMALCENYTYLKHRALNRATIALNFLKEHLPVFNWHKYQEDPDAHLKRAILRRASAPASGDADDGNGASTGDDVGTAETAGRGDDDDEEGAQHSALKKLLYSLNWLRTEVTRADCESQRLYEQSNGLAASQAEMISHLSSAQCRSAAQIERLKNELTLLRQQSADQTATTDRLMEVIQIAMQNKQAPSVEC